MKTTALKKGKRVDLANNQSLGVQMYGKTNDYPQEVQEIANASCTGKSCLSLFQKFVGGRGFKDANTAETIVNTKGQTMDAILELVRIDYAQFGGVAIHVNYNLNYTIKEIQVIPFEHVRFEKLDPVTFQFSRFAIYEDWGRRNQMLKQFKKENIIFIDEYDESPEMIQQQVDNAGGWHLYKGQVYFYSNQGSKSYPLPSFDSVLTDMSTEEGISNVSYRNARNNFFPAGMLVDRKNPAQNDPITNGMDDGSEIMDNLIDLQGDEQAGKMLYVNIESEEEKPDWVPFESKNFDKQFEVTQKVAKDNIGRAFNQPPILRCEDVGGNFGADSMKNAYNFYNSHTESDRMILNRFFTKLFKKWNVQNNFNFEIEPLKYESEIVDLTKVPEALFGALSLNEKRILLGQPELLTAVDDKTMLSEKLGVGGTQSLVSITTDPVMTSDQKRGLMKILFNFTDEQTIAILPL